MNISSSACRRTETIVHRRDLVRIGRRHTKNSPAHAIRVRRLETTFRLGREATGCARPSARDDATPYRALYSHHATSLWRNDPMATPLSTAMALRLASWITAINVLVASGFSIAGLVRPEAILPAGAVATPASLIFAMYAAARTIPLALMTLAAIYQRSATAVLILGLLAGVIQAVDAAIGVFQHDWGKSIGPLVIAVLQFVAVFMLKMSVDKAVVRAKANQPVQSK